MSTSLTIIGRLTRDPELKTLPSGDTVCNLRLAVDEMAPGRETGYIDVATYGKPGEAAARVLSTGWQVAVFGRLEYRTWQTDDGGKRHSYQAVGQVKFLGAPRNPQTDTDTPAPDNDAVAVGGDDSAL